MNRHQNWKLIELFIYVAVVIICVAILISTNWGENKNESETVKFGGESHAIISYKQSEKRVVGRSGERGGNNRQEADWQIFA